MEEENIEEERKSKDRKINWEEKKLSSFLEGQGWYVFNVKIAREMKKGNKHTWVREEIQ